ncbi:MAG: malate dehydrogenase, partial [Deltaproteobacteria bacterium]|nr:malate dehydrogenase [Deltaproteobacteria bacterium]
MPRKKIAVVGAGNVGASVAAYASAQELGDVVLLDILEGIPEGKGLDMFEAAPVFGVDTLVKGTNSYAETANSDLVVITAGIARRPGMSRDDLLATNVRIVGEVAQKAAEASPNSIMIVVSNPLDAMVYTAWKKSGFAPRRVMGMAGVLDTARFRTFLAQEIGVSVEDIYALVLGGHGDTM